MRLKGIVKTWRVAGSKLFVEFFGGTISNGAVLGVQVVVVYGVAPVIDASLGNDFVLTVTDGVAFVLAAPTNPPPAGYNQKLRLTYRNTSGGAHGAGTLNAVFKGAALAAVANGFSRTIEWQWNGVNWVEQWRSAADIAN